MDWSELHTYPSADLRWFLFAVIGLILWQMGPEALFVVTIVGPLAVLIGWRATRPPARPRTR
jgi:hypothetical protein